MMLTDLVVCLYSEYIFTIWGFVMRARKQRTDIRRQQIAEAVLAIIAEAGLAGLNVAAVAARVGLVPSGIYRHYPGKDALIDAALDAIATRHAEGFCRLRALGHVDALERLRVLFVEHLAMIQANSGIPQVVFSHDLHAGLPARRAKLLAIIENYLSQVEGLVRVGQESGALRADVAPDVVAKLFFGLIQPMAFLRSLSGGALDVMAQAEAVWPVFVAAIRKGEVSHG